MDKDGDEIDQLISGKKTITGIEKLESGEWRITFEVRGREITLEGPAKVDNAPVFKRPWEEPGWLAPQYAEHGSFRAVAQAFGFSNRATKTMQAYAQNELGWRIQEGFELRRWEFIARYFADPDPRRRPTVASVAHSLGTSQGHASQWKGAALRGQFFSKHFSFEKLIVLQNQVKRGGRVFFPDSDLSAQDFVLGRLEGWPNLPPGLLSDLLPHLTEWETISVTDTPEVVTLALEHAGEAIAFDVALTEREGTLADVGETLLAVHDLEYGVRKFNFARAQVEGRVCRVLTASAGAAYRLR